MAGVWVGKDYSPLEFFMKLYNVVKQRRVFELIRICEYEYNKYYEQRRKQQESLNRVKR